MGPRFDCRRTALSAREPLTFAYQTDRRPLPSMGCHVYARIVVCGILSAVKYVQDYLYHLSRRFRRHDDLVHLDLFHFTSIALSSRLLKICTSVLIRPGYTDRKERVLNSKWDRVPLKWRTSVAPVCVAFFYLNESEQPK